MKRRKHRDIDDEDDDVFFDEFEEDFEEEFEEDVRARKRPARRKGNRRPHEPWKAYPCPTCGRAWEGYGTQPPGQKKSESKFTWLWVIIAVILLIAITVSIAWWGSTLSTPDDDEPDRVIERDVYVSEGGYHWMEISD